MKINYLIVDKIKDCLRKLTCQACEMSCGEYEQPECIQMNNYETCYITNCNLDKCVEEILELLNE